MSNLDRTLDRALSGRSEPTEDIVEFVEMARRLEGIFDLDPPSAGREKALFSAAVAARGRTGFTWGRLIAPVVAGAGLVAALGFASGSALPGDALYPVRRVLQDVGIDEGFLDEADERIEEARSLVIGAEDVLDTDQVEARALAVAAIQELAPVDELLEEVDPATEDLALRHSRLDALIGRATAVIAEAGSDLLEGRSGPNGHGPGGGEDSDDNSGPGSEADSSTDSSGPGSGDLDDDSSGSGSNDDTDDDGDSSDSGSGDSDSNDRADSGDDRSSDPDNGDGDRSGWGSDSEPDDPDSDDEPIDGLSDGGDAALDGLEGSDSGSD